MTDRTASGLVSRRRWLMRAAVLPATAAAVAAGPGRWWLTRSSAQPPAASVTESAGGPVRLTPHRLVSPLLPPATAAAAVDRLRIDKPTTVSALLHAVRLFGLDMPAPVNGGPPTPVRELLFDAAKGKAAFNGEPALVATRDGVRARVVVKREAGRQPARQAHAGQLLAVIGELGVPPDTTLALAEGRYTVRDILADTTATFGLDDNEIEWSAVGLALYLSPQPEWADKFGRRTTFDALARRLLASPFARDGAACQGTHLLHAATVIYAADRQRPVLSQAVREEVRGYLAGHVRELVDTQRPTGEWAGGWYHRDAVQTYTRFAEDATQRRLAVTVTGHHLEWLLLLPADLQPDDDVYRRAGLWLHAALTRATPADLEDGYCPYSHAGYTVQVLSAPAAG